MAVSSVLPAGINFSFLARITSLAAEASPSFGRAGARDHGMGKSGHVQRHRVALTVGDPRRKDIGRAQKAGREFGGGGVVDLLGRADLSDAAFGHDDDLVRHGQRL
ncbi:hypothetical protein [Yoonia sp.]|uniref:hypothetical protein n=1 Tax=Yoonia sp. TaxID=2212373 RepID=UPI0019FD18A6|nr:hypothetical protein [Yoonia sp.]MBE0414576.1 hypothetical protein [Yoonia sp.]